MYAAQNLLNDDSDCGYEVYDIDSEDKDSEDSDDGEVKKRQPMPHYLNDPELQRQRSKLPSTRILEIRSMISLSL
jgi:hypothetical protein